MIIADQEINSLSGEEHTMFAANVVALNAESENS